MVAAAAKTETQAESTTAKESELTIREVNYDDAAEADDSQQQEDTRVGEQSAADTAAQQSLEEKRQRRRDERKQKREREKQHRTQDAQVIKQLRRENRDLGERLSRLEGSVGNLGAGSLDSQMGQVRQIYSQAEAALSEAISKGDGEAAKEALKIRDEARDQFGKLQAGKNQMARRPAATEMDPQVARAANRWIQGNTWFDPADKSDPDTRAVLAADNKVLAEGYDPREADYYERLDELLEEEGVGPYAEDTRPAAAVNGHGKPGKSMNGAKGRNGSPPVGGGSSERPLGPNEVLITPERKKAMMDAGIWDDPDKRKSMLKRYQEYDKLNGPPGRNQ